MPEHFPRPSGLPPDYASLLAELKSRVRAAQVKAALSVNRELIRLHWNMGRRILESQRQQGWGAHIVERLSADLRAEFPDMSGFSATNLRYMRVFAEAWPDETILQQVAGELPWFHNVILLTRLKEKSQRLWYGRKSIEHGWSRNMLELHIDSRLFEREGKAITNFAQTLHPPQSDLAHQVLKDPYTFDFLTIAAHAKEKEVEQGLIDHVQKLLLELGKGFAFVGRQLRFEVAGKEYSVDLLFYNLHLRCFVVIDLKTGAFKPEHAGKLNFHLSLVDDRMRHATDAPTIGIVLVRQKNRTLVEYALRDLLKPIGVAEWQTRLVDSLPPELESSLPSIEDIESRLPPPPTSPGASDASPPAP